MAPSVDEEKLLYASAQAIITDMALLNRLTPQAAPELPSSHTTLLITLHSDIFSPPYKEIPLGTEINHHSTTQQARI